MKLNHGIFIAASLVTVALPLWAQSGYIPPKSYGSVGQATPANTSVPSPQGQGVPPGRPAPSQPMPTPMPFDKVQSTIDQSFPMIPDEVVRLLRAIDERQTAAQQNVTGRPLATPVTSADTLDLSPGSTPPVVRVSMGQGAVLSFADSAGRPWPIVDNRLFNDRAYTGALIGPHLYSLTMKTRETASLTIILKDLPRPILITLQPAGDQTDYLKEYTIPRFLGGEPPPAVAASSREGALSFNSPELLNYLYRTPPKGVKQLIVGGLPGVMVWQTSPTKMVVRTSGQVVIPAFSRRHASSDGVAVFEVPLSPVISITEGGALNRVSISGYAVESGAVSRLATSTGVLAAPK